MSVFAKPASRRAMLLAPLLLAAQAVLVHWAAGGERLPEPPDFAQFPAQFGEWTLAREDPLPDGIVQGLGADRILSRVYGRRAPDSEASLYIGWYQSQRSGKSQPHSPVLCLPGNGWMPGTTDRVTIPARDEPITVDRWIVSKGKGRAVVLFWYQRPRRAVSGEWAAKFWLAADALRDRRTDTSLVRVMVWQNGESDQATAASAAGLVRDLYPVLRVHLPR